MISAETIETDSNRVACDGGGLGYPRKFFDFGDKNEVVYPCRPRRFVPREVAKAAAGN